MKRLVILLIGLMGVAIALPAREVKRPDTYNYNRGVEAVQNENMEEAFEYLGKELEENPGNGYVWAWMAVAYLYQEEYGQALTAANVAVRKVPQKDETYRAFETLVYAALASACSMACGETVKWNIETSLFCTYNDKTADLWNLNG